MRIPSTDIQDALYDALDCDPVTGELRWRENRRRVTEGDLAGSINRDGHLVVGFRRKVYMAAHIAWMFQRGEWPLSYVLFIDKDPMNLAPDNLFLKETEYVKNTKSDYMRDYRAKRAAKKKAAAPTSTNPHVTWTASNGGAWCARSPQEARVVLATFKNKKEAEAYVEMTVHGRRFCHLNRPATFPEPFASQRAGGQGALTLQQAAERFAYDPATGAIFHRSKQRSPNTERVLDREGTPAIIIDDMRRPVVRAAGRSYSAGMMAWFLHTGDWPKRKQLVYRDEDPKNTRFENLYLKGLVE